VATLSLNLPDDTTRGSQLLKQHRIRRMQAGAIHRIDIDCTVQSARGVEDGNEVVQPGKEHGQIWTTAGQRGELLIDTDAGSLNNCSHVGYGFALVEQAAYRILISDTQPGSVCPSSRLRKAIEKHGHRHVPGASLQILAV
jgi:hypothetical protein